MFIYVYTLEGTKSTLPTRWWGRETVPEHYVSSAVEGKSSPDVASMHHSLLVGGGRAVRTLTTTAAIFVLTLYMHSPGTPQRRPSFILYLYVMAASPSLWSPSFILYLYIYYSSYITFWILLINRLWSYGENSRLLVLAFCLRRFAVTPYSTFLGLTFQRCNKQPRPRPSFFPIRISV